VLLFWDSDGNGSADEAIALVGANRGLLDPLDMV